MVARVRKEMEVKIREAGKEASLTTGVHGLHPEELKLLGKLKYRTSYGQNVLQHSIEVSLLAGLMASQLGVDIQLAKRTGLLHDIGKSMDHEVEGTHPQLGADIARRFNENDAVCEAILNHHSSSQPRSLISVLIDAADAISASRPGIRRDTMDSYIKKLEKLEAICDSYPGVEKTYAIQAGREVRVMVRPEKIGDAESLQLAREIAKRIEKELEYPGQIKVTLIRETRAVDYAK
jgi:ribonuclease Y